MTDFRALCIELTAELERCRPLVEVPDCLARAIRRTCAALAEPVAAPAGPSDDDLDLLVIAIQALRPAPDYSRHDLEVVDKGREILRKWLARYGHQPATPADGEVAEPVAEVPTYDDLSELCSEHGLDVDSWPLEKFEALWEVTRAVLARWGHQPALPAEGEVAELVAWIRGMYWAHPDKERATRAADLLEQRHPTPVPVAERLPGPEDCDGEGRCWWWRTDDADEWWELLCISDAREYNAGCGNARYTHWLTSTALPLPAGEVQP